MHPSRLLGAFGHRGPQGGAVCAGAFGTALLSEAVDSTDALAFLAGTNVGAAIYEYRVARLTRTYFHQRSRRALPVVS